MEIFGQLSPIAAFAYLATSGLALVAAVRAPAIRRMVSVRNWVAVALIFVLLAIWRLDDGEALVQGVVRNWTRNRGIYDDRYSFQIPVTLGSILAVAALIWLAGRLSDAGHSGKALCTALVMAVFTAVRATSLHAVDAFLYASFGPVHVNYVIDLGLTAVVAAFAAADCWRKAAVAQTSRRASPRSRSAGGGSPRGDNTRTRNRRR